MQKRVEGESAAPPKPRQESMVELIRHYRHALWEISRLKSSNPTEYQAMALFALRQDVPSHHVWCAYAGEISANNCAQCAELWERFPYDPTNQAEPILPKKILGLGGFIGGRERAKRLSPERRREIASMGGKSAQKLLREKQVAREGN